MCCIDRLKPQPKAVIYYMSFIISKLTVFKEETVKFMYN